MNVSLFAPADYLPFAVFSEGELALIIGIFRIGF